MALRRSGKYIDYEKLKKMIDAAKEVSEHVIALTSTRILWFRAWVPVRRRQLRWVGHVACHRDLHVTLDTCSKAFPTSGRGSSSAKFSITSYTRSTISTKPSSLSWRRSAPDPDPRPQIHHQCCTAIFTDGMPLTMRDYCRT